MGIRGTHRCDQVARLEGIDHRVGDADRRVQRVETCVDRISQVLHDQLVAFARMEASVEALSRQMDQAAHDLTDVEVNIHRMELAEVAEDRQVKSAVRLAHTLWSYRAYWLIPIMAAVLSYLSRYGIQIPAIK